MFTQSKGELFEEKQSSGKCFKRTGFYGIYGHFNTNYIENCSTKINKQRIKMR